MRRLSLWPRRARQEDGQATFEFALLIPVLVISVLFIVDGGIWMYKFVTVSNAVRDAARYASVDCAPDASCTFILVRDKAKASSSNILTNSDTWDIHWEDLGSDSSIDKGDAVVVKVHQDHQLLFFPFSFGVSSCVEMRLEAGNGQTPAAGGC